MEPAAPVGRQERLDRHAVEIEHEVEFPRSGKRLLAGDFQLAAGLRASVGACDEDGFLGGLERKIIHRHRRKAGLRERASVSFDFPDFHVPEHPGGNPRVLQFTRHAGLIGHPFERKIGDVQFADFHPVRQQRCQPAAVRAGCGDFVGRRLGRSGFLRRIRPEVRRNAFDIQGFDPPDPMPERCEIERRPNLVSIERRERRAEGCPGRHGTSKAQRPLRRNACGVSPQALLRPGEGLAPVARRNAACATSRRPVCRRRRINLMFESIGHLVAKLTQFFTAERVVSAVRATAVMSVALVLAPLARRGLRRVLAQHLRPQQQMLGQRAVSTLILGLAGAWCLREMGFEISVLLGAAGVVTIAVGYASQTSLSNLISGLFLIFEQPFSVGDSIESGGVTGEVLSVDLLSVKLRTADNLYVRVPNESLLKAAVTNLTRYDRRSFMLPLTVDVGEDLERVRQLVLAEARAQPLCLREPRPQFLVMDYDGAGVRVQLTTWCERTKLVDAKNTLLAAVLHAFRREQVALPVPTRRIVNS